MENPEENNKTVNVNYQIAQYPAPPVARKISIDIDEFQKTILLWLYYHDMFKIKAFSKELVCSVLNWINTKCRLKEWVFPNWYIFVPEDEAYKLLAVLYAKGLIESTEQNDSAYFTLTEPGKGMCKKYLLEQ